METHQPVFDVNYFIRKFEAIPDERWTVFAYEFNGGNCALGHCGMRHGLKISEISECAALRDIFGELAVHHINDGSDDSYSQPAPKARILAALYDIKARAESALDAYETRPLTPITKPQPVEAA